jgi:hypothetical protein
MNSSYNPLEHRISEVRDLPLCILLFWTVNIDFGSSGFESFLLLGHTILRSVEFMKCEICQCVSSSFNDLDLLRNFETLRLLSSH